MTGRDANPLDLDSLIDDTYHRRTATASTKVTYPPGCPPIPIYSP